MIWKGLWSGAHSALMVHTNRFRACYLRKTSRLALPIAGWTAEWRLGMTIGIACKAYPALSISALSPP